MNIANYLQSDVIEVFFKAFSMKDKFKKDMLMKYCLKDKELASNQWFKNSINAILNNE
jgi:hypothetical protein